RARRMTNHGWRRHTMSRLKAFAESALGAGHFRIADKVRHMKRPSLPGARALAAAAIVVGAASVLALLPASAVAAPPATGRAAVFAPVRPTAPAPTRAVTPAVGGIVSAPVLPTAPAPTPAVTP